ncbi:hypothetical protein ACQU0X_30805 [Pseudovibrio ascidiaceicola]|uniref:hypothetical protein n=1 Tax=Pseudovibrio ascidiaceicola TaxID=285279 RepID=UPI003D36589D
MNKLAHGSALRARLRREQANKAEKQGIVADSKEVRMALMAQVHNGDKTLEEVQAALKKIKRNAKKEGKITRNQAYLGKY